MIKVDALEAEQIIKKLYEAPIFHIYASSSPEAFSVMKKVRIESGKYEGYHFVSFENAPKGINNKDLNSNLTYYAIHERTRDCGTVIFD